MVVVGIGLSERFFWYCFLEVVYRQHEIVILLLLDGVEGGTSFPPFEGIDHLGVALVDFAGVIVFVVFWVFVLLEVRGRVEHCFCEVFVDD